MGLKQAVNQGIIPGPRMFVVTRAIVATGAYGPAGFASEYANDIPQGGQEASGLEQVAQVVRDQIKHGADWVKIYADYRWGPNGETEPTFTLDELKEAVDIASTSGRPVTMHATTPEGMRRAILAGVTTIEHGDNGTPEVFKMMAERGICLAPTLAAGDAVMQYNGWRKGWTMFRFVALFQTKHCHKYSPDWTSWQFHRCGTRTRHWCCCRGGPAARGVRPRASRARGRRASQAAPRRSSPSTAAALPAAIRDRPDAKRRTLRAAHDRLGQLREK